MSLGGSLMNQDSSTPSKNGKKVQITATRPSPPKTLENQPTGNGSTSSHPQPRPQQKRKSSCLRSHLNSLWSLWYGICITCLNIYIALQCTKRFLDYIELAWPIALTPPKSELHAYIILTGTATVLLPFFLATTVFKIGNLANDGFKIGQTLSTCSFDPTSTVRLVSPSVCRAFWKHSGPTCVILHIVIALCLLLPKLMMEARLIQAGFLSKDYIWKTDLDFLISGSDRMVVLSFITGSNSTSGSLAGHNNSATAAAGLFKPRSLPLTAAPGLPGQDVVLRDEQHVWGSISIEFLNYALALFVYAIRYPSVYWNTNKWFGTLFSLQLLVNGYHTLLSYTGISILYKIHVLGPTEVLPHLQHRLGKFQSKFGTPFVLDRYVTLALFLMTVFLVLSSSLVLYLYGYGRLTAFLNREKARRVIKLRSQAAQGYGYFTHCAALCCLLAISVCQAPLLYDLILVYRASLDAAILACVLGTILHLFLWVLLWLILTIKQHWVFKVRVTIGRATVRNARSIKLVTDVDLVTSSIDDPSAPLLVVGNGRTYAVAGVSPKRHIMNVIQKNAMEMRARTSNGNGECSGNGNSKVPVDDTEEQIYWLRPKSRSPPKGSPDSSDEKVGWFSKRSGKDQSGDKNAKKKKKKSSGVGSDEGEDDGDYARLRELPAMIVPDQSDDTASEDTKILDRVGTLERELLVPPNDPSPLLTPEPLGGSTDDLDLPPPPPTPPLPSPPPPLNNIHYMDNQQSLSANFLRRTDSGMPHDDNITPRGSDSSESGSGTSPPNSNNSDTSGVHSNSSRDSAGQRTLRSTSVDNLARGDQEKQQPNWRSFSLQRGMQPPTSQTYGVSLSQQSPQPIYSGVKITPTGPILMNGGVPQMMNGNPHQMMNGNPHQMMNGPQMPLGVAQSIYGSIPPTMQPIYGNASIYKPQQIYASTNKTPVITEGVEDTTVVIMRKPPATAPTPSSTEHLTPQVKVIGGRDNFGRSTNMKMTSFTDSDSKPGSDRMSATLPHFPTQSSAAYSAYSQHCLTMPAQHGSNAPPSPAPADRLPLFPNSSCNSFPRPHSSIPSHHNGVKLFNQNPYTRRHVQFSDGTKVPNHQHHTFPQLPNLTINYASPGNLPNHDKGSTRDSANFSMTSNEST
uniref:Protein tincar n=1 Tax=Cacopsylla melanoneura TaxID=428564 RepID=A0A8D8R8K1_9HEMI